MEDFEKFSKVNSHTSLSLHTYKVQMTQDLKPNDHTMWKELIESIMEQQELDVDFSITTFFSDEAHFYLDAFVNWENYRLWGLETP